jgi:glycosyltransferase involved in cell wall biosynthesis
VVLEALAAGVPALVSAGGGPKFIVRNGESGFILRRESDYAPLIRDLHQHPELRQQLSGEARRQSLNLTWERIFDGLFNTYQFAVDNIAVGSESVEWSRSGEGDEF